MNKQMTHLPYVRTKTPQKSYTEKLQCKGNTRACVKPKEQFGTSFLLQYWYVHEKKKWEKKERLRGGSNGRNQNYRAQANLQYVDCARCLSMYNSTWYDLLRRDDT